MTALAVEASAHGLRVGARLIRAMGEWTVLDGYAIAYDFSENKNVGLANMIQRSGQLPGRFLTHSFLDTQRYVIHFYEEEPPR